MEQQQLSSKGHAESSPLLVVTSTSKGDPSTKGHSQPQQHGHHHHHHHGSASVIETIINEAKTCMGTGCLALPYATRIGGIWLHVIGILAIGVWNLYAVHRLCQCLLLLPKDAVLHVLEEGDDIEKEEDIYYYSSAAAVESDNEEESSIDSTTSDNGRLPTLEMPPTSPSMPFHHRQTSCSEHNNNIDHLQAPSPPSKQQQQQQQPETIGIQDHQHNRTTLIFRPPPPRGTSTYSRVAYYAFGPSGLLALDILMIILFLGVVVAFVDATRGFLRDTPVTTGSDVVDAVAIALIIGPMSAVPDIGYLSKASAAGLGVLLFAFTVIAAYGLLFDYHDPSENTIVATTAAASYDGANGGDNTMVWNWFPENGLEGVSTWFGCVVFGYGVAPLTFSFRESMAEPAHMVRASAMALIVVATSYVVVGVGLYSLFPTISGDVLHMLPAEGWLPVVIRLSMAVVIFVTAPLLIVPCGQLIEGKIIKEVSATSSTRIMPYWIRAPVRVGIALTCVFISVMVPGFVSVLSLVGCASVATVGFVVPPLLFLRLRLSRPWTWDLALDVVMLVWGTIATGISTSYTFHNVVASNV
jgi:amino acid permease